MEIYLERARERKRERERHREKEREREAPYFCEAAQMVATLGSRMVQNNWEESMC